MSDPAPPRPCASLRCKEYYLHGSLDLGRCDDTTIYWCAHTQRPVGPDEDLALPETCLADRRCYEPPQTA